MNSRERVRTVHRRRSRRALAKYEAHTTPPDLHAAAGAPAARRSSLEAEVTRFLLDVYDDDDEAEDGR